jgi:L-threonylcarbamoyladenylate synthase
VSLLASAGLDTVAVRVPEHALARAFLRACGRPVVAPSANRSGRISPTEAAHVMTELGDRLTMILDGGSCPIGIESTVLDLSGSSPRLLRPGGIETEALREILPLEEPDDEPEGDAARPSPGMLRSHYAPALPVRLDVHDPAADEALLGFGPMPATRNLSVAADLAEAAANLFRLLRELDNPRWRGIAVAPIPDRGLGRAINDRLRRAAAPRE